MLITEINLSKKQLMLKPKLLPNSSFIFYKIDQQYP